jgi:hypothetical protein
MERRAAAWECHVIRDILIGAGRHLNSSSRLRAPMTICSPQTSSLITCAKRISSPADGGQEGRRAYQTVVRI